MKRPFGKVLCKLRGHPEKDVLAIEMLGVTVLQACLRCGATLYERSKDQPLQDDPDYDPNPPEGEEWDCCR